MTIKNFQNTIRFGRKSSSFVKAKKDGNHFKSYEVKVADGLLVNRTHFPSRKSYPSSSMRAKDYSQAILGRSVLNRR